MTNEEIVQKEMANHDKHYWALVQGLKRRRKGWGELGDMIGEGSTVAKAIWDKYENFDFYKYDRLGAAVSASPQPRFFEDFLVFFAKWWADMDLVKLRESMNDPIWADGKHCGDCTNQPATCNRCVLEDIEKQAADFYRFFAAAPAQEPQDDEVIIGMFCPSITECAAANKCLYDCHNKPHPVIVPTNFPAAQEQPVENSPIVTIKLMRDGSMDMNLPTESLIGLPEVLEEAAAKLRRELAENSPTER